MLQAASLIRTETPTLQVEGLDEFLANSSQERMQEGGETIEWVSAALTEHVLGKLEDIYGADFFERGIKDKDVKMGAYGRRMDSDPDGTTPLEDYVEFPDLRKIVVAADNWLHFQNTLNIPLPGQRRGLPKYLQWLEEFEDLKKAAEAVDDHAYTDTQMALLKHVADELKQRLAQL
jgi:hypothetical protein